MNTEILALSGISMYFPGIKALDDVRISVRSGEVHALIGENGAGKSTLVKVMTGVHRPTAGEIRLDGNCVHFSSPLDSQRKGIAAIHQETSMFGELSVSENIFMGHAPKRGRFISWKKMREDSAALLSRLGLKVDPRTLVKDLSTAERHLVEIAKALSREARVLIMDEPTSALTIRETEELFEIVRRLKSEGVAIVFISHKFEEIFEIADRYTVLRDGRYIGEGAISEATEDKLINMMAGRSVEQLFPKTEAAIGEVLLKASKLSRTGIFKDVDFEVHRGEILGFFGLVGAGRSEVMRALIGIDPLDGGRIEIGGKARRLHNPGDAMASGLVYVPEDRQSQGAVLAMSIAENITLPQVNTLSRFGFLNPKAELAVANEYAEKLEVKASGIDCDVQTLSGGNQQKVVLAKWLASKPSILILDEPTKGIDVSTKAAVHAIISGLAAQGLAVIMISSELPEIIGMSDRVVVMHEGLVTAVIDRANYSDQAIMKAAMGGEAC